MLKYVVITPVRDEEAYIGKTLSSVVAQTVKPRRWIIVDDGSADRTAEIVGKYAAEHSWITMIQREDRGFRQRGPGVVDAFYAGLEQVAPTAYEVVVKLDGDLSFAPDYFEDLLGEFEANPRLGIASGQPYTPGGGEWVTQQAHYPRTHGPTKAYRRQCFEAIGGLRRSLGWDGVDDWHARMLGWEARSFAHLIVLHHRDYGSAYGRLQGFIEQGQGAYFMGYHPLYLFARAGRRMFMRPYFAGGLGMIWGYTVSWLAGREQVEPELARFVRREQLHLLSGLVLSHLGTRRAPAD